ncbi:lysophospholipid acyltransferase family protein [Pacificimonas sp. WHA3]|uniref:Lysophospholipid acyltransferase family protein n=2 Tax=Pacificimonas pallii TaxID=2827236 RepID=A0ABS6SHH5_9SPHN|nr:lysophospholipid acyltransferase family protein [Pacificimonas pallii]MBV7257878.1 lysophospholipid acyltransferase family protein [Pacificimonas pallii]
MRSAAEKGWFARLFFRLLVWLYRRGGWTATGEAPAVPKYVLIAVPHTTNWDFPNLIGVADELGMEPYFIAKSSLFRWPMGRFMRSVGGIPVDRAAAKDMVQQMVDEFAAHETLALVIAPEGTRSAVDEWRSGFYRIAMAAGVPIVCSYMDYQRRRVGIGPMIYPTGDYEVDMETAFAFYRDILPAHVPGFTRP